MKRLLVAFLLLGPLSMSAQPDAYATDFSCDFEGVRCESTPSKSQLYPNPNFGVFEVVGLPQNTEGSLFSVDGRFQMSVRLEGEIDATRLEAGVYILQTPQKVFKFIKL